MFANLYASMLPVLLTVTPTAAPAAGGGTVASIVSKVITVVAGIFAIIMVIGIAKSGIELKKGNGSGSYVKIVVEIVVFILLLGAIYMAANYEKLGKSASNVVDKGVQVIETNVEDVLNP